MGTRIGQTHHQKCGSSDALQLYEEGGKRSGYCFSCSSYVSEAELDNQDGVPQIEQKPAAQAATRYPYYIDELITHASPSRGLTKETLEAFGVKTELSQADGQTVVAHYYPVTKDGQLTGWKCRKLPKDFVAYGDCTNADLFGQWRMKDASKKRIYITEGEEDAMALWQAIRNHQRGTAYESFKPAVVSLNNGASSAIKALTLSHDFIRGFEQIVLCFDQDDPGKKAAQEVLKLYPTALVAEFEEKDANDMVLKGKGNQLAKAVLFNAKIVKPSSVVSVDDVYERALAKPVWGYSYPWPSLTKATYGIQRKRLIGLGAGVGMGKSEWGRELQAHLIKAHGFPVGVFSLEEDVSRTLKGLAGKMDNIMYHRPDVDYPEDQLRASLDKLKGKVFMFDHLGVKDWDDISRAIRYLVVGEGVKDIFIDPLTALVAHLTSAEANDQLNSMMSELAGMVHELDFTCYWFGHLKVPDGKPHEAGGEALESQLHGSKAMMKWTSLILMLEGNKSPDLPEEERNTRYLIIRKDRDWGNVAKIPLFYNKVTGSLSEIAQGKMGF